MNDARPRKAPSRRIQLVVDPTLYATLGIDAATCGGAPINDALTRYARHLADAGKEVARTFTRSEWSYLADACNGELWAETGQSVVAGLAATVEDADLINDLGGKWFGAKRADKVAEIARKVRGLSEIQADAVLTSVRWYLARADSIDQDETPWWTVPYRIGYVSRA